MMVHPMIRQRTTHAQGSAPRLRLDYICSSQTRQPCRALGPKGRSDYIWSSQTRQPSLFFRKKDVLRRFKPVWLYVILSFAFYIPVAAGAGLVPMLGMLMIPKTVCYILLILLFVQAVTKDDPVEEQR